MDHLLLRKVQHPQAANNYRVILKTEYDGEFEIGSIGVKIFTSADTRGPGEFLPLRDHQAEGRGADRSNCIGQIPQGLGASLQAAGLA